MHSIFFATISEEEQEEIPLCEFKIEKVEEGKQNVFITSIVSTHTDTLTFVMFHTFLVKVRLS